MKKFYLMVLAVALGAAGATAADFPARLIKPAVKTVRSLEVKKPAGTVGVPALDQKAPARAESRWESIGTGIMSDDITSGFVQTSVTSFEVDVMEDKANPGVYRIVDPWKNHPDRQNLSSYLTFGHGDSYYITVDATDPAYVRVLRSPMGLADKNGETELIGLTECVGVIDGITQEMADRYAGKLENDVISFPVQQSLLWMQAGKAYYTNYTGKFSLALPGAELPVDYDFTIEQKEFFCPDNDGNYHVAFRGDERIASIRYRLVTTIPQYEEEVDALIADIAANGTVAAMNTPVTVSVKDIHSRSISLVALSLDDNSVVQSALGLNLIVPYDDSEEWNLLGAASFTEGFISSVLPKNFAVETYEVEVESNKVNPGLIRIVNPYKGWSAADKFLLRHEHNHHIYFNIEDVNNVYVLSSPMGIRLDPYGEFGIASDYAEYVEYYGKEMCDFFGATSGGSYRDGIIEFNADCDIKLLPVNWGEYVYANFKVNPEYDEAAAEAAEAAGQVYDVPEYLPGDFRLDMSKAGIGSTVVDFAADDSVTYYNLQGQRVSRPAAGTVCIRVQGGKSTKVQIR